MSQPAGRGGRTAGDDRALAERVAQVQRIAEHLTSAADVADIAEVVESVVHEVLGPSAVTLTTHDPEGESFSTLVAEGISGPTREQLTRWVATDGRALAQRAITERRALFWPPAADRDRGAPELAGRGSPGVWSWVVLPLVVRQEAIGVLSIGWAEEREFPEVESALLQVIAHQCAVAVDRSRIDAARRAERETLEFLNEGSRVIVNALEPERVLASLVTLAVPRLAPWCAVYVAEQGNLRRVAIEIKGGEELAARLRGELAMSMDESAPLAMAYRTGEPQLVQVDAQMVRRHYRESAEALHVLGGAGPWGAMVVPVVSGGETFGAMSLVSPAWLTGPSEQVRFAAEGLAARAGVALANARRVDDERRTATMLMEAFLPAEIPDVPGYDVAARYLPAGSRVAGDWYDVAALPSGQVLVGIGDAGGHGIPAVSLMGQLRNSARGLALVGNGPAAVLDALQVVTAVNGPDSFATALYGVVDPAAHAVRWAAAGHLPPLRFGPGAVGFVDVPRTPPLGSPAPPASERAEVWGPHEGVVLVTDGVVERRSLSLDEGLAALHNLVADHATAGAAELTERITETLCKGAEDDCCVVVLRRP